MARKEKKYHFIYKTTNLLSGKYYIGMHSTDNLNDGYMGSGKRLRRSLNKYGVNNHTVEILEFVKSRKELIDREKEIVNLNEIAKNECMNLMVGGKGGFISDEQQRQRSIAGNKALNLKREKDANFKDMVRRKISEGSKQSYKNGRKGKNNYSWKGKSLPQYMKTKIGNSNKGKGVGEDNSQFNTCWVNNGNVNKKIPKEKLNNYILAGWERGTKSSISKELLEKLKEKFEQGISCSKLSQQFSIPRTTIRENLKKYLK